MLLAIDFRSEWLKDSTNMIGLKTNNNDISTLFLVMSLCHLRTSHSHKIPLKSRALVKSNLETSSKDI